MQFTRRPGFFKTPSTIGVEDICDWAGTEGDTGKEQKHEIAMGRDLAWNGVLGRELVSQGVLAGSWMGLGWEGHGNGGEIRETGTRNNVPATR